MNIQISTSQNGGDPIELAQNLINDISPEEDHVILAGMLGPVFRLLAQLDETTAKFFVLGRIRPRFKLSNQEINSLMKLLREYREKHELQEYQSDPRNKPRVPRTQFDGVVDIVQQDGKPVFLMKDTFGTFMLTEQIELENQILIPPPIEQLPYLLPRADWVMAQIERYRSRPGKETDSGLVDELLQYFEVAAVLSEPGAYLLVVAWVLHSYLLESFSYTPFLWLFSPPGHGKTRLGRAIVYASMRGLHLESLAGPHIIRLASDHAATLFFDLKDLGKKLRQEKTADMLALRFQPGAVVPKVLQAGKGAFEDTQYFTVSGATIIASNEPFDDVALEERSLCLQMPYTPKSMPDPVSPESALLLREKLTAFRAWHMGEKLPLPEKSFEGRLGDISRPLLQVMKLVKPEHWMDLYKFIRELDRETKASRANHPDVRILMAVKELAESSSQDKLGVSDITRRVDNYRDGRAMLSVETVGRRLKVLGFCKTRIDGGRSVIYYDRKILQDALRQHGLGFFPVVPSEPSLDTFEDTANRGLI
jgi:hypothetical protein